MGIDRRELLIGAASSAALPAMPWDRARAAHDTELFAAARRDDRGSYSAALFSLEGGDVRSVELPERGHDIAYYGDSRFVGWGGGIPIRSGEEWIGSIAVSGLTSEEDVALATLGASAVT